ncbi:MAG: choice-of-anchor Q domain-containing protein [Desulfurococcaceae archaeon]
MDNDGDGNNTPSPVNLAHNLFSTSTPSIDFSNAPQTEKVYIRLAGNYNQNIANGCTNTGQYDNIQADPKFVNPQNGDLRLQASSPAINAGCNNAPSIPSTDKDGNPRIVGTAVDMGAYEYQGQQQPQQYTLTVNKSGTGSGTVTSNPSGINCGSTCSANFDANTTVTLTATASSGSIFAGWSGDCSSCVGITCSVLMDANKTCNVSFMMPTTENTARLYVFWDSRPDLGNVKVDPPNLICNGTCRVDIYRGLQVRLTAIPSSGARFLGWSGACSTCGFSSSCVITMDSSKSCRVRFGY